MMVFDALLIITSTLLWTVSDGSQDGDGPECRTRRQPRGLSCTEQGDGSEYITSERVSGPSFVAQRRRWRPPGVQLLVRC